MAVIANLVVGSNGGTTLDGRSRGLSTPADRERFHELRKRADAIVIGGQTSRFEPYSKTPVPLIVLTRKPTLPGSAATNPQAILSGGDLAETLAHFSPIYPVILIEAGATLVVVALQSGLLDELFLTEVKTFGGEPFLTSCPEDYGLVLLEESQSQQERFLHYARLPAR